MIPEPALQRNLDLMNVIAAMGQILPRMIRRGAPISEEVLCFKEQAWRDRLLETKEKVFSQAGIRFNFNSHGRWNEKENRPETSKEGKPATVKQVLYGKLGYKAVRVWDKETRKMKVTTSQYALGKLYYEHGHQVLRDWGLYNRLRHRKSNFVDKFLLFEPCTCKEDNRFDCEKCAGSGFGKVLGPNPRYITVEKDSWYTHPVVMMLAVTGRPICLDPNLNQWPRNNKTWNIDCRDIFVAPEGYLFSEVDRSKAERVTGAVMFEDDNMLKETQLGARAFSSLAVECLGLKEEECAKGTDWYTVMKTSAYADQYFCQGQTLHEYLMKNDIYLPVTEDEGYPNCETVLKFLAKKYAAFKEHGKDFTWRVLQRDPAHVTNMHGRLFRLVKSPELEGYRDWREIEYGRNNKRAKAAFAEACRKVISFVIQGSATGDDCLLTALKIVDDVDRLTKPSHWDKLRIHNGDWEAAYPWMFKYDEWAFCARKEVIEQVQAIQTKYAEDFGNLAPFLSNPNAGKWQFNMKSEASTEKQWNVEPEEGWQEMTKDKNSKHFYTHEGVRFKA